MSHFQIQDPADIKQMSLDDLETLAQEIRQKILTVCMKNGGHLGASLGAVELAIALHAIFNSPKEPIIWDVGHQAYAHKLLTGRWDLFDTLRQLKGISGFPSREESHHDAFGTGHSSTSLSAALGFAWARRETSDWTVAVIGDGGLTSGLALAALNNFCSIKTGPSLIVVNDNQMSISKSMGALPAIISSGGESKFFSDFGFDFHGTVDGHDLRLLLSTLLEIREKSAGSPVILHVLTQKGRGYAPAEELPGAFHGVSPIREKITNLVPTQKSFSDAFGDSLSELASTDDKIVVISAAMTEGTGLDSFSKTYPDRFFDVGIAEDHAVTFAAGLAASGYKPVVAIYSTFLQRGLDQIIHDVALQNLGVTFAVDRAGLVGADGATHHGMFDLAFLGMIPGLNISAPECLGDMMPMLREAINSRKASVIRYPRGDAPEKFSVETKDGFRTHFMPDEPKLFAIALGATAARLCEAAKSADPQNLKIAVISTGQIKPIAGKLKKMLLENPKVPIIFVEDGISRGGTGQTLSFELGQRQAPVVCLGYGDHFIPHGATGELEAGEGLSAKAIAERMKTLLLRAEQRK